MFHFKGVVARIVPVEIDSEIFACWVHLDLGREKWQEEKKGKACRGMVHDFSKATFNHESPCKHLIGKGA